MHVTFKPIRHTEYDDALGQLPPAVWKHDGFLVGEPVDHRYCTKTYRVCATWSAYFQLGKRYFIASIPLTVREFRAIPVEAGVMERGFEFKET